MMQVSHEIPKALLEKSFEFNDYDYFLPTFANDEDYLNHFIEARKRGRFIIMDNGLFENDLKGEDDLLYYYELIKPDVFITPDVWNEMGPTLDNYRYWKDLVDPSKIMVVLQAKDMFEAEHLYDTLVDEGVKYIGFNHLAQYYDDYSGHPHFETRKTFGRIEFISFLKQTNRLSPDVHHHLLGCNFASEFKHYPSAYFPEIKSCDTSNPVTLAFEGIEYKKYLGLNFKPKTKVEDVFESVDRGKLWLAEENIKQFKQFIQ
jgi:hypothetical protein